MKSKTYTKELVNGDGEIVTIERQFWQNSDEKPFIKMYCDDIGLLSRISPFETQVLLHLAMSADYRNEVHTNKDRREKIAKDLNSSENSIQVTIYKLEKRKLIAKRCTGLYMLDPTWFTKNSWVKNKELKKDFIKMTITYSNEKGRVVEVE